MIHPAQHFTWGYFAYKLNKQGDNIQPWCTPFPMWNQSVVPCPVLTVASWPAYMFLKRWVRWSGIPISFRIFQFIVIHTVEGFSVVNRAEIDVFMELSCFFDDPADIGNLMSGSSAFSKSSLNIWKFSVHILLKPGLENFEHYFTSGLPHLYHPLSYKFPEARTLTGLYFYVSLAPFPLLHNYSLNWIEYKALSGKRDHGKGK